MPAVKVFKDKLKETVEEVTFSKIIDVKFESSALASQRTEPCMFT